MKSKPVAAPNITDGTVDLCASIASNLMSRYGPLLDAKALAEVLKFPTLGAFERSLARGHIQLKTKKFRHRRGTFALAHDVAQYVADELDVEDSRGEPPRERGA